MIASQLALPRDSIIGAGFIKATDRGEGKAEFVCYGNSTSLEIESQGQLDSNIANIFLQDMIF